MADLGTVRPDYRAGQPDVVRVRWRERSVHPYDGSAKYRNLQHNPAMSLLLTDPNDPLRFLEVRGALVQVVPDPEGAFYLRLARRYGSDDSEPPADSPNRVVLVMDVVSTARH